MCHCESNSEHKISLPNWIFLSSIVILSFLETYFSIARYVSLFCSPCFGNVFHNLIKYVISSSTLPNFRNCEDEGRRRRLWISTESVSLKVCVCITKSSKKMPKNVKYNLVKFVRSTSLYQRRNLLIWKFYLFFALVSFWKWNGTSREKKNSDKVKTASEKCSMI